MSRIYSKTEYSTRRPRAGRKNQSHTSYNFNCAKCGKAFTAKRCDVRYCGSKCYPANGNPHTFRHEPDFQLHTVYANCWSKAWYLVQQETKWNKADIRRHTCVGKPVPSGPLGWRVCPWCQKKYYSTAQACSDDCFFAHYEGKKTLTVVIKLERGPAFRMIRDVWLDDVKPPRRLLTGHLVTMNPSKVRTLTLLRAGWIKKELLSLPRAVS